MLSSAQVWTSTTFSAPGTYQTQGPSAGPEYSSQGESNPADLDTCKHGWAHRRHGLLAPARQPGPQRREGIHTLSELHEQPDHRAAAPGRSQLSLCPRQKPHGEVQAQVTGCNPVCCIIADTAACRCAMHPVSSRDMEQYALCNNKACPLNYGSLCTRLHTTGCLAGPGEHCSLGTMLQQAPKAGKHINGDLTSHSCCIRYCAQCWLSCVSDI